MKPCIALLITFLAISAAAHAALAQMCPNTNPDTDTQMGCAEPFYATLSKPRMSHGMLEFNITVKNRKVILVPDCNPGERFCFDNINYQGLPLCQPWSGNFSGVKVGLASCSPDCRLEGCPDCDFNVTVTPSAPQDIGSEQSRDYIVRIDAFTTDGEYDFTFAAFLSSVKKKVFTLHLNITSQVYGIGGDNAVCPICSSEKCDVNRISCGYSCPGAIYCSAPECLFDTAISEAAEYCCGDDAGEVFKQCSASAGIDWLCPSQSACCQLQGSCAYSGNCYQEGVHLVAKGGEDEYSYCRLGKWHDCDEGQAACSDCGFSWKGYESECCGDDSEEYFMSRICFSGCENNITDKACCTGGSACVYEGQCYATGDLIVLAGKNVSCEGGVWSEKANQSSCYKGECSKKDKCEGSCPGCIFKDFSCYGTTCEPDFIDPDMHWSYCGNCSLNWSYADKRCCGDDENEFWVAPCPNANASWACCSNPEERVNFKGECVISCGIGITPNASVLDEGLMLVSVSFSRVDISVQAGKNTDFNVIVTTGSQTLHNVVLDMCGPFSFESSPEVIEELRPGDIANFSVRIIAGADAALGASELAAYVSSSELIRQRYTPWSVTVSAGFPSFDFYILIAVAAVAAYGGKRLLSPRKPSGKVARKEDNSRRESGRRRLAKLVREELDGGASEKELRRTLASHGLDKKDVEAAFREAKKR